MLTLGLLTTNAVENPLNEHQNEMEEEERAREMKVDRFYFLKD